MSEWAAYFRAIDEPIDAATPAMRRRPRAGVGEDPEVSWQRLLSFADGVNASRGA